MGRRTRVSGGAARALALCGLGVLAGCSAVDLTMRNPVADGQLASNHIVKTHGYAESQNGLPEGSMADEATIDVADKDQVCVTVSLHELGAIDLTDAEVKLTTSTGSLLQPQLTPEPPTSHVYPGLVPFRQQTGFRVECRTGTYDPVCNLVPVYKTAMVAGRVEVFNTRGRFCAQNQGLLTPETTDMALKIVTETAPHPGLMGHADKKIIFRWAFARR